MWHIFAGDGSAELVLTQGSACSRRKTPGNAHCEAVDFPHPAGSFHKRPGQALLAAPPFRPGCFGPKHPGCRRHHHCGPGWVIPVESPSSPSAPASSPRSSGSSGTSCPIVRTEVRAGWVMRAATPSRQARALCYGKQLWSGYEVKRHDSVVLGVGASRRGRDLAPVYLRGDLTQLA